MTLLRYILRRLLTMVLTLFAISALVFFIIKLPPGDYLSNQIAELAAEVKDANFRIETSSDGIHVYNRDGHHVGQNALSLFDNLGVERDGAHAFYLGTELMKAEISWLLGKRYAQDAPLDWGCAADLPTEDLTRLAEAGHTLRAKKR